MLKTFFALEPYKNRQDELVKPILILSQEMPHKITTKFTVA